MDDLGWNNVGWRNSELRTPTLDQLLNPGDEVVLIEPLYDSYLPIVQLAGAVPALMDRKDAGEGVFAVNEKGELNSIQIVLLHEMGRFNKLLKRMKTSLVDLGKAIKGLVVMSGELDAMFSSMLKNQVPALWEKS